MSDNANIIDFAARVHEKKKVDKSEALANTLDNLDDVIEVSAYQVELFMQDMEELYGIPFDAFKTEDLNLMVLAILGAIQRTKGKASTSHRIADGLFSHFNSKDDPDPDADH